MSNVSKLAIKSYSDNKFSTFTGEFITSVNPENLMIKSGVAYHAPQGISGSSLLKYCGSPPELLTFSLLFDNTGIIPGSNTIGVMEQIKQLQDVAYTIHKKNNAPNYIRIIWGQIDFKGRLVELDIVYSMFKVDGTLVRAEAKIAILEEVSSLKKGKSAAGIDSNHVKISGANATSNESKHKQNKTNNDVFAPTPNGMNGAYSGAPNGAYDGKPDNVYQGSSDTSKNNSNITPADSKNANTPATGSGASSSRGDIGEEKPTGNPNEHYNVATSTNSIPGTGSNVASTASTSSHNRFNAIANQAKSGTSSIDLAKAADLKDHAIKLRGQIDGTATKLKWWHRINLLAKKVVAKTTSLVK